MPLFAQVDFIPGIYFSAANNGITVKVYPIINVT
jgi:hypothetical protein